MSKIPRPSPRTYKDLPITDDEKKAAIPRKVAGRPKEENKKPKQSEKTAISNAALPSTSKSAKSSKARQSESLNRLKKATTSNVALPSTSQESTVSLQSDMDGTLKRSKTEPAIELDNVTIQTNERITRSQANKASNFQPAVHAVKKGEVAEGAAKLRLRLSFRDKKPTKEPKREQLPSNSKKQFEKTATSDAAIPMTSKEPAVSLESTMDTQCETLNRSNTEPATELDHVSIQRSERLTTLQAKQASNLQQAGVKGEVSKGAAKLKQRLSFRDKIPIKEPRRKQTPRNSEKQLEKVANSNAAIPSTSKESALSLESTIDRKCETLTRSKTESAIELDQVSIRRNERITTLQANQATDPAVHGVKKDEVPKGAAKVKQRLSFRDKKPRETGIRKIKSNTGNADNISPALKTRTAESFKSRSDQLLKNRGQILNRSKTESSINLEKVTKRTSANKVTQMKQQIKKPSKEKDKQVKPLDSKVDISPKLFEDIAQNGSPLQAEFISRKVAHSGLKFVVKPRKKTKSLNFNSTQCNSSQISIGDHDSSGRLAKEEPDRNV